MKTPLSQLEIDACIIFNFVANLYFFELDDNVPNVGLLDKALKRYLLKRHHESR